MDASPPPPTPRPRLRRPALIAGAVATAAVLGGLVWWALASGDSGAEASAPPPTPSATATSAATPTPTPTPTPTGFAANTAGYDVTTLPQVNVFAVIPALAVDAEPFGAVTGESARPLGIGAPVWSDPADEPVAYLPRDFPFDGTTVPILERQEHWVQVLLVGRQSVPTQGDPSQVAGWMRDSDVEITSNPVEVRVDISERTVDIVRAGVAERIATDFAWGDEATPTPMGRSYIMTTRVVEEYWYTRGHPIVYLSVQSPTLDGFAGADVAVTAFHYHDDRSGAISNGCIRLGPEPIAALAELPEGTPVIISP
jgi:hypothetical protein